MYILLNVTHFDSNGNYHVSAETDLPDNESVLKVLKDTVKTMEIAPAEHGDSESLYERDDL